MSALLLLTALVLLPAAVVGACGCELSGGSEGEGDRAVDVSMGGTVMAIDRLDFEAVSYQNQRLELRNRATEHALELGVGTPILAGDGTEAAHTLGSITMAPGQSGTVTLSAPLAVGQTYYLGAPKDGGKPGVRQLFICPGGSSGGGGFSVPDVQDVEIPE